MNFLRKTILLFSATALLLGACSKDPAAEQQPGGTRLCLTLDGVSASTQGSAGSATHSAPSTHSAASTRAVSESAVNNLWVLQCDASGAILTKQYIASVTDPTFVILPTALNTTVTGSTLYVVANTGNAWLFSTQTLAQAKALTVALTTTTGAGIPADASTALPMVGQSAALTFPLTAAIPVNLTRTVAKVTLTVKNLLTTGYPKLTVTSTQLKNVPVSYPTQVVDAANGFTGTTYYPTASAGNFKNYNAVTGDITAAGRTTTYYVAPNVRGVGTATEVWLKNAATAPSGQGDYCTYVEILGTAQTSATASLTNVRYRVYLGGNTTTDFNLLSNTAYTVGIELAGLFAADVRVTLTTDKFDLSQGPTDGSHTGDSGDGWTEIIKIGDVKDGGIVYEVTDATNYKVFSQDQGSSLKWSVKTSYVLGAGDGQDATNGRKNVDAMKTYSNNTSGVFATDFPAAGFCEAKNTGGVTGWYLPAIDELTALYTAYKANQTVLDAAITANSGTAMAASGNFWSGTEHSSSSRAWYVNLSNGSTNNTSKTGSCFVRCVKTLLPIKIGDVKDGGIVYEVTDATNYKVFSLDQGSTVGWSAKTSYVLGAGDGQDATDGRKNVDAMMDYSAAHTGDTNDTTLTTGVFATDFPAAGFCEAKNTGGVMGWYLPAKDELTALYNAYKASQTVLDAAITANSGTAMAASGVFWSGTERNGSYAWCVNFSTGAALDIAKGGGGYVRCVRAK